MFLFTKKSAEPKQLLVKSFTSLRLAKSYTKKGKKVLYLILDESNPYRMSATIMVYFIFLYMCLVLVKSFQQQPPNSKAIKA